MVEQGQNVRFPENLLGVKPLDERYMELTGHELDTCIDGILEVMNIEGIHSRAEAFRNILHDDIAAGTMKKEDAAELAVLFMNEYPEDTSGHVEFLLMELSASKA